MLHSTNVLYGDPCTQTSAADHRPVFLKGYMKGCLTEKNLLTHRLCENFIISNWSGLSTVLNWFSAFFCIQFNKLINSWLPPLHLGLEQKTARTEFSLNILLILIRTERFLGNFKTCALMRMSLPDLVIGKF